MLVAGLEVQMGLLGPRRKREMQGKRGTLLPCLGRESMQQSCKISGHLEAEGAKDVGGG